MEILVSTSIHLGSPLESIGGVVLMLDVNIYINFSSLGGESIVVHGRWRLKILTSASIYWGSPLEVEIQDTNVGGDHCSPWGAIGGGDWNY